MTDGLVQVCVCCIYCSVCVCVCLTRVCTVNLDSSFMFCGSGCVLFCSAVQLVGGEGSMHPEKNKKRKEMHARQEGRPRIYS